MTAPELRALAEAVKVAREALYAEQERDLGDWGNEQKLQRALDKAVDALVAALDEETVLALLDRLAAAEVNRLAVEEIRRLTGEPDVIAAVKTLLAAERALSVARDALNETDILRAEAEITITDLREQIEVLIAQDEVEASIQRNLERENARLRAGLAAREVTP